jgi:hypothetical protein
VFLRKLRSEFFERKSAAQPVAAAQLEPAE